MQQGRGGSMPIRCGDASPIGSRDRLRVAFGRRRGNETPAFVLTTTHTLYSHSVALEGLGWQWSAPPPP
eukprot:5898589-Alexandrium_andersonii.AAC.1